MTARARRRCDFPWTLTISGLAIAATASAFASPGLADLLVADPRIAHGQPWRALTGPLVHATWGHLVRDLALVAIAGAGHEAPLRPLRAPLFAAGLVLPGLAVLAAGDAQWYCGLSGLSHALLAAALSYELVRRRGAARAIVLALAAVAAAKPIYELVTGAPAFAMSLGDGVVQVPLAHVTGALTGIACGLLAGRVAARAQTAAGGSDRAAHLASCELAGRERALAHGARESLQCMPVRQIERLAVAMNGPLAHPTQEFPLQSPPEMPVVREDQWRAWTLGSVKPTAKTVRCPGCSVRPHSSSTCVVPRTGQ